MATMNVKDASGATVAIEKPLAPGRVAAASAKPVALSNEDSQALADITAKLITSPATTARQDEARDILNAIASLDGTIAASQAAMAADMLLVRETLEDLAEDEDAQATSDMGPGWTTLFGVGSPPARFTSANASAADAEISQVPASGQKLVITDVTVSVEAAMRVDLKEETSGTVKASFYMPANSTYQFTPRGKLKLDTADKQLMVRTNAPGNITVSTFAYSEA